MKKLVLVGICSLILFACKKEAASQADQITGQWKWVIQKENNPAYFSTPASTGIQETLEFDASGQYRVTQNNNLVNAGTYRTAVVNSTRGELVSAVMFSNARVNDSTAYYRVTNNTDSLMFCYDLIGSVGSSSRFYGKVK